MSDSFTEWAKIQNIDLVISKKKRVEMLFDEIENAQQSGAKIWHLVQWLKQAHDLDLTEQYLQTALYRIRKERRNEPITKPVKPKTETKELTTNNPQATTEEMNLYDVMMEKYKQCGNQVDKYIAMGGKREDIEEQNISTQRNMVMNLRNKLRQKYKGIY